MFSNLSKREHILLLTAIMVMISMGYWIFRWRGQQNEIEMTNQSITKIKGQSKKVKQDLVKLARDADARGNLNQLTQKLKKLKSQLTTEANDLHSLRQKYISISDTESVQLQIADLASSAKVHVRSITPVAVKNQKSKANSRFPQTKKLSENANHRRRGRKPTPKKEVVAKQYKILTTDEMLANIFQNPRQELVFDSTFEGLQKFVDGLNRLQQNVVILKFDVKVKSSTNDQQSNYPLHTTLILAL